MSTADELACTLRLLIISAAATAAAASMSRTLGSSWLSSWRPAAASAAAALLVSARAYAKRGSGEGREGEDEDMTAGPCSRGRLGGRAGGRAGRNRRSLVVGRSDSDSGSLILGNTRNQVRDQLWTRGRRRKRRTQETLLLLLEQGRTACPWSARRWFADEWPYLETV
ncbi:hypothetical protein B0T18DRAFT_399818 [Schizothecium vesticola]|uniref:Secreted protein n=1 Tax=Schizothecium vesticola TaxID=314040 RepID=A0AA40FBP4_9PEZI|nr:hypothetical protein B0T18DRAFT_399818 [Schizothecium vesticola]